MKTTEQKIKEKEEELQKLKNKLVEEQNNKDFIYIKDLEEHLPTYEELKQLRNLEHLNKYKLGLINTWEFVKQEDRLKRNIEIGETLYISFLKKLGLDYNTLLTPHTNVLNLMAMVGEKDLMRLCLEELLENYREI